MKFQDEHGMLKSIKIGYEWKPIICDHCKLLGHLVDVCKKKKGKKKWVAKHIHPKGQTVEVPNTSMVIQDTGNGEEGFTQATNTAHVRKEKHTSVVVANSFQIMADH